jgi:hypothetical protein
MQEKTKENKDAIIERLLQKRAERLEKEDSCDACGEACGAG